VIFGGLGSPPPEKFSVPRSLNFKSEWNVNTNSVSVEKWMRIEFLIRFH
jgi:hypothetical protein